MERFVDEVDKEQDSRELMSSEVERMVTMLQQVTGLFYINYVLLIRLISLPVTIFFFCYS